MKRNTKLFCAALALVLVFGAVVGGTLAWLLDSTAPVVNTFTVGNIVIALDETNVDGESEFANSYKMIPGDTIAKDPKVTVKAGSEAAYVFVKIDEANSLDTFVSYTVASPWQALDDVDGVYYIDQTTLIEATEDVVYPVITDNQVTVNSVTEAQMAALRADDAALPSMTFTAYAIQKANIGTAAEAWTNLQAEIGA